MAIFANHFVDEIGDPAQGSRENRWNMIVGNAGLREKVGNVLRGVSENGVGTSSPMKPCIISTEVPAVVPSIEVVEPPPPPRSSP